MKRGAAYKRKLLLIDNIQHSDCISRPGGTREAFNHWVRPNALKHKAMKDRQAGPCSSMCTILGWLCPSSQSRGQRYIVLRPFLGCKITASVVHFTLLLN